MPHGQRDWSNIGAEELVFAMDDMAELAARLGSPITFNREGNVLFVSTFEHGVAGFGTTPGGDDAEIVTSALWSRTSGYCCKLVAGKTTPYYALIYKTFPYPTLGSYGLELSFLLDTDLGRRGPRVLVQSRRPHRRCAVRRQRRRQISSAISKQQETLNDNRNHPRQARNPIP